jgi:DNA-binding NarL/FixJ family response regulator
MTVKDRFETTQKTARIMIVDDHPSLCEGLGHRISAQPDLSVCGMAADVDEAIKLIRELKPDLVIVDIALKKSDGLDLIKSLKSRREPIPTLAHSMYDESLYADRCLHAGAMGYVNKEANPDEVIKAIREILAGRIYLSPEWTSMVLGRTVRGATPASESDPVDTLTDRQLGVFRLIGEGLSAQEIARRLHISVHTVDTHRENIKRKLNVDTGRELNRRAVIWLSEQG